MGKEWNWKEQRDKNAFLAFEDGTIMRGYSIGAKKDSLGESVFNTGMTGYQEILSDPSYCGQFVTLTYPEIGNTGINDADMESASIHTGALIINNVNLPSNWRSEKSLHEFLIENNTAGIAGIDTRALTTKLRNKGTLKTFISVTGEIDQKTAIKKASEWSGLDGLDYAAKVTCKNPYTWDEDGEKTCSWGITDSLPDVKFNIAAYDFGIKWNILRSLRLSGMNVKVFPAQTPAEEILNEKPDALFLSNGPGDPAGVKYAIDNIKKMLGELPIMGICLGHQLLSLACGAETYRLKFGHHGCNHPVKDLSSNKVEITSQNHNFAVDIDSLNKTDLELTHINLNDNTAEGVKHKKYPAFSVQYHPEACPGPHDPYYLFAQFKEMIIKN